MSEHEQWFKSLNANGKTIYFLGDEHKVSKMAWDFQQAKIDRLSGVLDERTSEWLQAIDLGTYFQNVAKPLKEENDSLKAQLNNMEQCYIQLKQEHNELIKHDTRVDRKWKSAEKVAEKYKRKVSMIADLLRDSTDQDMTLKAIKTVIDRVGEHG